MFEKKEEKPMLSSALLNRTSFGFSAENPMGERNGGSRGKDCEKLRPCIQIKPQEEVVLCDTDGPGMLTHLWFTGYVGHSFILRIYWDGMEAPVYFHTSFRMTMDNLGWTGARYDDYTSVAYWYMEKPSRLSAGLPSDEEIIMK